jgi:hypothetical protein
MLSAWRLSTFRILQISPAFHLQRSRLGRSIRRLRFINFLLRSDARAAYLGGQHRRGPDLATRFDGDLGAADWPHFGRLAGFTNRKPKYAMEDGRFPFVRVIEHSGDGYSARAELVKEVEQNLRETQVKRGQVSRAAEPTTLRPIDAFRSKPLYAGDHTRSDLAYAMYALAHGCSEEQVASTIRTRELSHKGNDKRQQAYVRWTLSKASNVLSRGHGR